MSDKIDTEYWKHRNAAADAERDAGVAIVKAAAERPLSERVLSLRGLMDPDLNPIAKEVAALERQLAEAREALRGEEYLHGCTRADLENALHSRPAVDVERVVEAVQRAFVDYCDDPTPLGRAANVAERAIRAALSGAGDPPHNPAK